MPGAGEQVKEISILRRSLIDLAINDLTDLNRERKILKGQYVAGLLGRDDYLSMLLGIRNKKNSIKDFVRVMSNNVGQLKSAIQSGQIDTKEDTP